MQPVPQEQHQHQDGRRRRTQQGQGDILGLSAGTFHGVSSLLILKEPAFPLHRIAGTEQEDLLQSQLADSCGPEFLLPLS